MMRGLWDLAIGLHTPERTKRWSARRWASWLDRSARLYFVHAAEISMKRGAFHPFLVEPLSQIAPADQLFRQLCEDVPEALPTVAEAAAQSLSGWRAEEREALARFLIRLTANLSGYLEPDRLREDLSELVARVGPPLETEAIHAIIADAAECAIGRLRRTDLMKLGDLIERRSAVWGDRPWRAQLRLLQVLVEHDGLDNLFENIVAVIPDLDALVTQDTVIRNYVGDIMVDALGGLSGVVRFLELRPRSVPSKRWHALLYYSMAGQRVREEAGFLRDLLHDKVVLLPPEDPSDDWASRSPFIQILQ